MHGGPLWSFEVEAEATPAVLKADAHRGEPSNYTHTTLHLTGPEAFHSEADPDQTIYRLAEEHFDAKIAARLARSSAP